MTRLYGFTAAAAFVAAIVAANYATAHWGFVAVGFGLTATAGTYFAGATFVFRDSVQDALGVAVVLALIVIGAALSWWLSTPQLALASGCAFALAEVCDLAIYTPLRERGYLRAAVASNVAGSVIDTVVFLLIAGFPLWASLPGQLVGKLMMTGLVFVLVVGVRLIRAVPRNAVG